MDHSSIIYLMDKQGTFLKHFSYGTDAKALGKGHRGGNRRLMIIFSPTPDVRPFVSQVGLAAQHQFCCSLPRGNEGARTCYTTSMS